jgi:hypothetical protein
MVLRSESYSLQAKFSRGTRLGTKLWCSLFCITVPKLGIVCTSKQHSASKSSRDTRIRPSRTDPPSRACICTRTHLQSPAAFHFSMRLSITYSRDHFWRECTKLVPIAAKFDLHLGKISPFHHFAPPYLAPSCDAPPHLFLPQRLHITSMEHNQTTAELPVQPVCPARELARSDIGSQMVWHDVRPCLAGLRPDTYTCL